VGALLAEGDGVFDLFKPGDRVRVLSGPFRDYEGVFDMRLRGTDRVRILLEMVGQRSAAVQLRESQIGK
jgi:transcriptional antiterminator RfaH